MNNLVGIIGAMDIEVESLKSEIRNLKTEKISDMEFYCGSIGVTDVIVVKCGIGKVNAARCAQTLCDHFGVSALVNTGIGGGIGDGLAVGDLVVAKSLVQHDFDVSGFGYAKGYMFLGNKDEATHYVADKDLIEKLISASELHISKSGIKKGVIATGDIFVCTSDKKKEIKDNFDALVCEMEGGAIAQTAVANSVPFAVIRAISDLADGSAPESYEEFEKDTAYLSAKIIKSFLEKY